MTDPDPEDHAVGVELQLTELVEEQERARVQGLPERVTSLQSEIEALQDDLADTADRVTGAARTAQEADERSILDP